MSMQEEYAKWIDARSKLVSELEKFKAAVEKADRVLHDELEECCDEAELKLDIYER